MRSTPPGSDPVPRPHLPGTRGSRSPAAAWLAAGHLAAAAALGLPDAPVAAGGPEALAAQEMEEIQDPRAGELVDRWIHTLGGMERYWDLRTATFTLTTEIWDAESGRMKRARPRYVTLGRFGGHEMSRVERWEGDDYIEHGWDGEAAWARMNGRELGPGDKDFDEATLVASDVQYWVSLPYKLNDPGVNLHYDGTDAEGREVVRVTFGEGVGDHQDVWWYRFEPDGGVWPVQVEYVEEGSESVNRLRFEDIRTVDGYVFVGRRVHFDEEGRLTKVLDMRDFRFNPDVDAAVFSGG